MNVIKHAALILLLFVSSGCKKIYMASYGIKQPKVENYQTEKKTLEKYGLPTDEILSFKDSTGIYKISYMGISIPDAAFFDARGNFIPYLSDTITCNAGVSRFIRSLRSSSEISRDTSFRIDFIFDELVYSRNQSPPDKEDLNGKYDFHVMFFWTVFTGKLNKDKVYEWYTTIEEEKLAGLNIRAYYINLDCQEFWGYSNEDLPKFNYLK